MDSGLAIRIRKSRTAEVCRLCLKKRYLVDINENQYLRMQLLECFPHCTPDDSELPQFVCGECYQLIDITYQFSVRTRRTEVLLRTYVHMGGDFPVPETLEAEYRRNSKRSASPEKQEEDEEQPHKKRRSSEESSTSTESKERKSSKHKDRKKSSKDTEKKDSSKDKNRKESSKDKDRKETSKDNKDSSKEKDRKERKSLHRKEKDERTDKSSKRSRKTSEERQKEQYYRSDEYLFGEVVELDPVEKRNDSIEDTNKDVPDRVESIASNLPGLALKMSYNEMLNVLKTIENMQNNPSVSV
ncbi:AAEL014480-PA [Aedes aegypti]|uniref:AAEL014480-PA n=2 Tax=Aedes aegypti TaxID=7159 RepID=A0A1S4G1T6_AEDAE|nr:luc7-like protein 3 [Aedes aegypti]EAT33259.1 AAEL014480-PA [Aedes aegypti]